MTTTISLLNMKGGVGKTTLAVELSSHCFTRARSSVLLIDLDPQFNASQYLMSFEVYEKHVRGGGTIADLLIDSPPLTINRRVRKKSFKNCVHQVKVSVDGHRRFDILPSQLALSHVVKNPAQMDYTLEKLLAPVRDKYDYVFIDCAPTDSILTTMALMASDFVLVPVRPDRFSILGYGLVAETMDEFRAKCQDPHNVRTLGTVFTQVGDSSGIEGQCMREIRETARKDDSYVFESLLPYSRTFLRAVQAKTPAFDTKYVKSSLRQSISAIARELKERIDALSENGLKQ